MQRIAELAREPASVHAVIRKRSIFIAIDDGRGDEVKAKPIGDSLPNTKAEALRSRRRFGQWGVC